MRSPLFKKVGYHPPHSVACRGCYTHSLASRGDRHERSTAESSYYPEEKAVDRIAQLAPPDITVGAVDHPLSVISHGQLRRFLRGQVFPTLMVILVIL